MTYTFPVEVTGYELERWHFYDANVGQDDCVKRADAYFGT